MAFVSALVASAAERRAEEVEGLESRSALAASGWPSTSTIGGGSAARQRGAIRREAEMRVGRSVERRVMAGAPGGRACDETPPERAGEVHEISLCTPRCRVPRSPHDSAFCYNPSFDVVVPHEQFTPQ